MLDQVEPWDAAHIEQAVKGFCDQRQLGLGKVAQPIRVAVSGTAVSPPIFETLEFLGREDADYRRESIGVWREDLVPPAPAPVVLSDFREFPSARAPAY